MNGKVVNLDEYRKQCDESLEYMYKFLDMGHGVGLVKSIHGPGINK